jgi:hypothetical protein
MAMTAERSGSCSTALAPLDVVEAEGVAELVPLALAEALALVEEEDTGNRVSVKQFKKGKLRKTIETTRTCRFLNLLGDGKV